MFNELKQWREERGLDGLQSDKAKHFSFITEEVSEGLRAENVYDVIDAYADIIVFAINAIEQTGFYAEKVMAETLKEINSRKGAINNETKKWEKYKDDYHKSLWYKAEYSKCEKNND